ncbi:MAG: biopolymer transporter ExbD [Bacteroides sp.]|nr:biopolymer transporter ExbD [Bacteroides sp.]MDE6039064.1 biopolymer transporter ExbD [Paramuribaculum sp.]MBD5297211.1 biopolymer transporter ExbD [Bacteroides sp.]MBD5320323.1 biopolymer transporter ExbD [Bacteroides sp.]MBD5351154.1 biopolymer transporter ExbD [Bacteroides sp.]
MAQIEQSDKGGKKKKGAQKKMAIHVDFTPMVDMNMLLITFFMLCTTMLKSQTLKIALPTNEKVTNEQKNQAGESQAMTLLLDVKRDANGQPVKDSFGNHTTVIYYYEGALKTDDNGNPYPEQLRKEEFLGNENNVQRGIRKILHDKNRKIIDEVNKLKDKWRNKEFSANEEENQRLYEEAASKVRNDADLKFPIVMIKATPEATWESVIGALDEMSINEISHYQLENLNNQERKMLGLPIEEEPAAGEPAPSGN